MEEIELFDGIEGLSIILDESNKEYLELFRAFKGASIGVSNKDYIEPEYGLKGISIQIANPDISYKLMR